MVVTWSFIKGHSFPISLYLQWCNLSPLNWSNDFFFDRFVIIAQKRLAWGVTLTLNLHILHFSFQQKT